MNKIIITIVMLVTMSTATANYQPQELKLIKLDGSVSNTNSSSSSSSSSENKEVLELKLPNTTSSSSSSSENKSRSCQLKKTFNNGFNIKTQNYLLNSMTSRGWSCTASVYMLGSILTETSLNITAVGYDGYGSVGIKQWHSERKTALMRHCNPWGDLDCQVDFMFKEMNTKIRLVKGGVTYPACHNGEMESDNLPKIQNCIEKYTGWKVLGRRWEYAQQILENIEI